MTTAIWAALAGGCVAAGLSLLCTPVSRRVARGLGFMDSPAGHKTHARPTALLGGSAVMAAVLLPAVAGLVLAWIWAGGRAPAFLPDPIAIHLDGITARAGEAAVILAGALAMHVLGLVDDKLGLGPWTKLLVQLAVACGVVLLCPTVRVVTALGPALSIAASVLWLTAIINAMNFLDNMDGLATGVAMICALALLGAALAMGQVFVAAWLGLLIGALAGFLPYNFHPASSFLGDAGSLVIGYFLGVLSGLTTYVGPGQTYYLYGVFVPAVVMALPLYDMASVITLRLRARKSPMVGDRRHLSHRLIRRGFSVPKAVATIYLCTAAAAMGALLLPRAGDFGAVLVFAQTLAVLGVLALLESVGPRP